MKILVSILLASFLMLAPSKTIYNYSATTIDGEEISMKSFEGKVLLIVNTASKCGYTPQYKSLESLYKKYHSQGFEIIGFPANNFMKQEPGSNEEIKSFCEKNYGVSFPMMSKISVKGKDIHPLYSFLTSKEQNGVIDGSVKWNFQKYLINQKGEVIAKFSPGDDPMGEDITKAIESLL